MDKKAQSKPMREIISRLPGDLFEVATFGDDCILNKQIEDWPVVECLIAFHSDGYLSTYMKINVSCYCISYPLEKAIAYADLRTPFLVNDLEMQRTLLDRRLVYDTLQSCGVPVPPHVYVNRDGVEEDNNNIEEFDDHIVINGTLLKKPFVEKPVDADDHNVIVFPR